MTGHSWCRWQQRTAGISFEDLVLRILDLVSCGITITLEFVSKDTVCFGGDGGVVCNQFAAYKPPLFPNQEIIVQAVQWFRER
jgi:hypothetical protein